MANTIIKKEFIQTKRPPVTSTTASTLNPNLAVGEMFFRTTQTATLTIEAPTNAVSGDTILVTVASAAAQTLNLNSTYKAYGVAFPATTTAGKKFMLAGTFNGTNWDCTWATEI